MLDSIDRFFNHSRAGVQGHYEGTINPYLGDGFMALFGAPVTHQDRAQRAALAALEIRRKLTELDTQGVSPQENALAVRIGPNTGNVIVANIGGIREEFQDFGSTTNVAARLQQMAQRGEILASEVTASKLKHIAAEAQVSLDPELAGCVLDLAAILT